MMYGNLFSFSVSLLIGLLIGIERERSHIGKFKAIGVRTFVLLSLLGTLTATLNQLAFTITISSFVFLLLLLSYVRSTIHDGKSLDIGITTETSAALIYCLGYIIPTQPLIAIIISAITLLILIERRRLHTLARRKFQPHEIETIIILIIFVLGLFIVLPDRTIDPWGYFNPRQFCILTATVAAIQLIGYIAIRLFGQRFGLPVSGFISGLISSTAVFANLSNTIKKNPDYTLAILASGLLAIIAMLIDVLIIIFVGSHTLFAYVFWPIASMITASLGLTTLLLRFEKSSYSSVNTPTKPDDLYAIIKTSTLIGLTLILAAIMKRYIGEDGLMLASFVGGLFEIHGVSLAATLLYLSHKLSLYDANLVLLIAISATFASKFFLLWTSTPARFAFQCSLLLMFILTSGTVCFWLTH